MRVRGRLRTRTALPVSGVPLRGRTNPYIAVPYRSAVIYVEVEEARKTSAEVRGPAASLVSAAVDRLGEALGEEFSVRMEVKPRGRHPALSVYSSAIPALVKAVARLLGVELGREDVREYSSIIDGAVGLTPEYIDIVSALRLAQEEGRPVAYRRGEAPIPLPEGVEVEVLDCSEVRETLEEPEELRNAMTHLAGLATLAFAGALRMRDPSKLASVIRVENAVWYAAYGVSPPLGGDLKVIPDIGGVCFARLRI